MISYDTPARIAATNKQADAIMARHTGVNSNPGPAVMPAKAAAALDARKRG